MKDPDAMQLDMLEVALEDLPAAAEALASEPALWPRQLAEHADAIEDELQRLETPLEPMAARRLACRLTARIARSCGGTCIYLPKDDSLERVLRDMAIWSQYDGNAETIRTIAQRLDMTAIHVYRVVARQRALHRRRFQVDLFDEEGAA